MQDYENPYAALVSRLIEFGYAPEPDLLCPAQWRTLYDVVKAVHGSKHDRQDAFAAAVEQFEGSFAMASEVYGSAPERENRGRPIRFLRYAAAALGPPPQLEWLVEGLLLRPSLNVLVGDPGSKKTLTSIDLAVSIALGQPWLGRSVTPAPAIFIDEETGIIHLHNLLNGSLRAHQATAAAPLSYLSLPQYNFRDPDDCEDLLTKAEGEGAGLIVIDALASVMRGGDENSSLSVAPLLNNLRLIAETARCAILLVHHNNKEGSFRGSSVISAGVDLMLSIESAPGDDLIHFKPLKSRFAAPQPFSACIHFNDSLFHLTPEAYQPAPEPEPQRHLSNSAVKLLTFLRANGESTTQRIMNSLEPVTPNTVRQLVHHLSISGHLVRVDGGDRGAVAIFKLTEKGETFLNAQPQ